MVERWLAGDRYVVMVEDSGTPSRSVTQSLIVQVLDTNDERPRFDQTSYYFSIAENRPVGSLVGTVHAADNDLSTAFNRVTYRLSQVHAHDTQSCVHLLHVFSIA